jgi:hypothetical protein
MIDLEWEWQKCRQYELRNNRNCSSIGAKSQQFDTYRPLKVPALFAKFADATASPVGMLDFCKKFGLPTGEGVNFLAPGQKVVIKKVSVAVDVLLAHQTRMRRAVRAFEAGDPSELVKQCNGIDPFISARIQLSPDPAGQISMRFAPPDLMTAMWLQFAQLACAGGKILRCDRCEEAFVVGTGTGRRNTAVYCSNACKVASFKASKERADR